MIPDCEFNKLCFIDKHLREKAGAFSNVEIGVDTLREATSMAFEAIILSRIVLPPTPKGDLKLDSFFIFLPPYKN